MHSFTISGQAIQGGNTGVVIDPAGNLYGVMGSTNGATFGTVYELSPQVDGSWTWKVLESFPIGSPSPLCPCNKLTLDAAGNLYGSAPFGGLYGFGAIFELTPTGDGAWTTTLLRSRLRGNSRPPQGRRQRVRRLTDPDGPPHPRLLISRSKGGRADEREHIRVL